MLHKMLRETCYIHTKLIQKEYYYMCWDYKGNLTLMRYDTTFISKHYKTIGL